MVIIDVNHVSKEFQLGQLRTLKQAAVDLFTRLRGHHIPERAPFKALDDVDFQVKQGEVVGIIGQNGAGKSTLLKLLAGISKPTRGSVEVRGKVAPLIEVGAGMVPDLTGRENIFLNASILGLRRSEISAKFDEIVAFAELEEFIDTPIKRYSSGMSVRLGFSIAASVEAEILIVDEVLAVGDLAFQRKCFDRMEDLIKRRGKTVVLVSHNLRQVERLCQRAIILEHGRIAIDGDPKNVCRVFYERSDEKVKSFYAGLSGVHAHIQGSGEVELLDVKLCDQSEEPTDKIIYQSDVILHIRFRANNELPAPTFGFGVHTTDFLYLATHNSESEIDLQVLPRGEHEVICRVTEFPFLPGAYALRIGITAGEAARVVFYGENILHFQVVTTAAKPVPITSRQGFVEMKAQWAMAGERTAGEDGETQRASTGHHVLLRGR